MNNENNKTKPVRSLPAWGIALIVLGFPLWFSLIAAAVAVVFALYVSVWAVIISLWALWLSLIVCVPCGFVAAIAFLAKGEWTTGALLIGTSFYCAGLAILGFFGCVAVSKGVVVLTKKAALSVKNRFSGKEKA